MLHAFLERAKRRPVLSGGFVLAGLAVVFFAVRLVVFTVYWSDPMHRDQHIEGWMTPGYVAHSWHVPPQMVGEHLGITRDTFERHLTLADVAKAKGVETQQLVTDLEAAILTFRAGPKDE